MKQLIQSYRTGKLNLTVVPAPAPRAGHLVVQTRASLVSVGTEKYMLELASKSLLGKALARPDLVRQVVAKAQSEGILEAWRQALGRLDAPVPLGYSSAGVVLSVGPGVEGFSVGDRVACTGSGFAGHAEIASVPVNLCVRLPESVSFDAAAFVALGGIALEAVRMARVSLGETVAVIGLGLLGQLAVQLLRAAGCHVLGMDINAQKIALAQQHGADATAGDAAQFTALCLAHTNALGVDAAIIFAATPSNEPLELAATVCRERGRVVATGLVGLDVPRKPFYDKELELVISRAWGPGLYDAHYTQQGVDYPLAYARWTAGRNMQAFLAQLARGALVLDSFITHRFPFERAIEAYDLIMTGREPYLGVLLTYERDPDLARTMNLPPLSANHAPASTHAVAGTLQFGVIGAGLFANGTLLPALKTVPGAQLHTLATSTGVSANHAARRFGFAHCTTDASALLSDPGIDAVLVLSRHGMHAAQTIDALRAGKHVFVEKPLAMDVAQLDAIRAARESSGRVLMVGYNRRYAPHVRWLRQRFAHIQEPLAVHITVNAGPVPADHWVHDPQQGGGRLIGEVCHFVDLIQYLCASLPVQVYAQNLSAGVYKPSDNVVISMRMAGGGLASITYVSGGDKRYPRERVEVFGGGATGVIENFRAAQFWQGGRSASVRSWLDIDRGHRAELQAFAAAVRSGQQPVPFDEYAATSQATFALEESLRTGAPVSLDSRQAETGPHP